MTSPLTLSSNLPSSPKRTLPFSSDQGSRQGSTPWIVGSVTPMHGASEERKTGRWLELVARFALAPTANASEPAPTTISRTATTNRLGIYTEHPS